MKIIKPGFWGELANKSVLDIQGYIITGIKYLEIIAHEKMFNDITALAGVCCLVSEHGKSVLLQLGLNPASFHLAVIKGIESSSIYYIDLDAVGPEISIYLGTSLLVSERILDKVSSELNLSDATINEI